MRFSDLGLCPELLRAVEEAGYTTPTPIQQQAIPVVLAGHDVMGGAQTGTGKTAGFTLPLLNKLMPHANTSPSPARHPVRALVLTPTRELAIQVEASVQTYAKYTGLRSTVVYGGVNIKQQIPIVKAGVEVLVATPGRLLDHLEQKTVSLSQVTYFVLDEADRMLDMGFIPDIMRIMKHLPKERQSLLFSATFSADIKKLAESMLKAPKLIEVARRNAAAETVKQSAYHCPSDQKRALLEHLVKSRSLWQTLCFVRTRHGASRLARLLEKAGLAAEAIHGDKTQSARIASLEKFKEGKTQILVATDVAARGLDIEELPVVINYEMPNVPEDYVHRIGRTGRAGAEGEAISLVSPDEEKYLAEIEKLIRKKIERVEIEAGVLEAPRRTASHESRSGRPSSERTTRKSGTPLTERKSGTPLTERLTRKSDNPPSEQTGRARQEEREAAYAKNPDQPLPKKPARPPAKSGVQPNAALMRQHLAALGRGLASKQRPVPALLMKRAKQADTHTDQGSAKESSPGATTGRRRSTKKKKEE
ncbi:MAG: DEAD/DEAH box helicase [Proteobacteria bacterium]|nr:DEAD/DEAH box helicase [Pseudomonadota bacterium]MCL2307319.1 DEAD/DEAH box helicase [Pseudomonadota bacterium]